MTIRSDEHRGLSQGKLTSQHLRIGIKMKFKRLSILYWLLTVLVAVIMGFAGVILLFRLDGSLKVLRHLGYPVYFSTLIGITRLAGSAAILLPVPKGLREWAYAGLTFDIMATIFSILSSGLPVVSIVQPVIILIALEVSYFCWRRRLRPDSNREDFQENRSGSLAGTGK